MSSAAARAEARKKAILSRGSDRLAKLTSSARGEEAATTFLEPPKRKVDTFVGDATDIPPPTQDPNVEQQMQFLTALMQGNAPAQSQDPNVEQQMQFLTALMQGNAPTQETFAAMSREPAASGKAPEVPTKKSLPQKFLPLLHLAAMWLLLAYFVIWVEPSSHSAAQTTVLDRWAALLKGQPNDLFTTRVNVVPFFWAFTTLQILLHSLRIFGGLDRPEPPTLVALVLPHLPPPFPGIITHALKYLQMGGTFLNDISLLIVGMGLFIWFASLRRSQTEGALGEL